MINFIHSLESEQTIKKAINLNGHKSKHPAYYMIKRHKFAIFSLVITMLTVIVFGCNINSNKSHQQKILSTEPIQSLKKNELLTQDSNDIPKVSANIYQPNENKITIASKSSENKQSISHNSNVDSFAYYNSPNNEPGPLIQANQNLTPKNLLPITNSFNLSQLPSNFEIHVVSGYEPKNTYCQIFVDRPGKNIVLILSSYEKVLWQIEATTTTHIRQIFIGGDKKSAIQSNINIPVSREEIRYTYETDNIGFKMLLNFVKNKLQRSKINSFSGNYRIPQNVNINNIEFNEKFNIDYPRVKYMPNNISFKLLGPNGYSTWTPSGPVSQSSPKEAFQPESKVASIDGKYQFKIGNNSLIIMDSNGQTLKDIIIPQNFPDFSWAGAIAYSPDHNLILVGSLGGEGFIYRFDLARQQWKDYRSMNNLLDIQSLTYDPYTKHFIGISNLPGNILFEMTADGVIIKQYKIESNLPGFLLTFDQGNGSAPILSIIPCGANIVLIQFENSNAHSNSPVLRKVQHIWVLNRQTGQAVLTYKAN